ncbi:MAG: EF-P beta-lysylation protein EpmB [Gammaproteobacteria bacterium]|jgi:EF-P beta-lysylation protein EpmB
MIPRSHRARQPVRWQTLLGEAVTDPEQLLRELELPARLLPGALRASAGFRLQVPRGFVRRMAKGDPADPLLRQVLPLAAELEPAPGFRMDPLDELESMPKPGVLHKYRGRVLLTVTGACAVHCRYCFRRHYPYKHASAARENARHAIDYLRSQPEVDEVILSGGDPLTLPDSRLAALVTELATAPQLRRLRIHSRLPVVLPERVDSRLLQWMTTSGFQVVLVIHCNHPNEIDLSVRQALEKLRAAGVTLLNQAVLLRGVNDRVEALAELSTRLFEAGVLPYYLHQLDPVQGAAHFEVDDRTAKALVDAIRSRLPGYLVPRLVREQARQPHKTPIL